DAHVRVSASSGRSFREPSAGTPSLSSERDARKSRIAHHLLITSHSRHSVMRLPVLMFDFGNVIGHFDYATMFEQLGARLGISPQQFETMVYARGAARLSREFERGFSSAEEFARQITAIAGLDISFQEFEQVWPDIFSLNEPVAQLVAGLKRNGYTL